MNIARLPLLMVACLLLHACASPSKPQGGWYLLKWAEQPARHGPSRTASPADRVRFLHTHAYTQAKDADSFDSHIDQIQEGDVLAYRMRPGQAYGQVLTGRVNSIGYRMLRYGHLAIVVKDPQGGGRLRLFSSQSFKGPNTHEGLDTLRTHDWDVYRLDQWQRIDKARLDDFVRIASEKAGKWYGYDFSGMFGLWNAELKPRSPDDIGHEYICSSVVVTALYYAGIELDAIQRGGLLDLVSPQQVVSSPGRIIAPPDITLNSECKRC